MSERVDRPEDAVLVGYGEIGVKSRQVRVKMERRLTGNVQAVLDHRAIPATVERQWSRVVIRAAAAVGDDGRVEAADADAFDPHEAAAAAAEVPGVVWARPVVACAPELDAVLDALDALAARHEAGATFAVDATRAGDDDAHDFSSRDVLVEGGAVVGERTGADVDLDDPDRTYRVEVREDEAFVSVDAFEGARGLPLGTQGSAVALVSGGIDSPVAAWETMRRGCRVVPVYVDLGAYGGPDHRARAVETVRALARRAPNFDLSLRIVPAGDLVETLMDEVGKHRMLSLRRAMLRVGEAVAEDVGAHSVVTGESMGQKSSQTGANLAATDAAVDLPVHRPLLTRDKSDIMAMARELGTYSDSTIPVGCERVAPSHPETYADRAAVEADEPDDLFARAAAAAADAEVVDVLE